MKNVKWDNPFLRKHVTCLLYSISFFTSYYIPLSILLFKSIFSSYLLSDFTSLFTIYLLSLPFIFHFFSFYIIICYLYCALSPSFHFSLMYYVPLFNYFSPGIILFPSLSNFFLTHRSIPPPILLSFSYIIFHLIYFSDFIPLLTYNLPFIVSPLFFHFLSFYVIIYY